MEKYLEAYFFKKKFGKMNVSSSFVCVFSLLVCATQFGRAEKVNYGGYKMVRIFPTGDKQWNQISELPRLGVTQVFMGRRAYVDFLFPPHQVNLIEGLREGGFNVSLLFEDVQRVIDSQKVNTDKIENGSLEWDRYYRLEDIYQFLEDQAARHNSIASVQSIGTTYEGREMRIIKISKSGGNKPVIWIDSQIHAREWITGAVCTFIIDQLLNSNDTEIQGWLDNYDFYILPVFNADGFEYTHTTDRFWRKSRSENGSPVGCRGTDLNRNFDFHWLENGGASPDPCSNTFAGTSTFSDIEAVNVANFLNQTSSRLVFYLSLHSAGQYILIPTGFSADRIPQYNTYMRIGRLAAEAHKDKFGTVFTPGSVYDEMYVATGSSMDWVKDKLKTNLTITYELRDRGQYGHLLPPEQIYPSCLEFMDGLKVLISELSKGIPEVDP